MSKGQNIGSSRSSYILDLILDRKTKKKKKKKKKKHIPIVINLILNQINNINAVNILTFLARYMQACTTKMAA